jgi:hypothetical protein
MLIRQLDAIRVLVFPFVFLGKNLFEPERLSRGGSLVHQHGIMKHNELLAASITPKRTHLPEMRRSLSRLPLLDRYRFHRLTFYLSARLLHSP